MRVVRADDKKLRSRFATVIAAGWLGTVGLLTFVFPASNRYMGRIVSISETAQVVVLKDGRPESFRLAEVEFPEKGQPHAKAARAFANRLALGRDVHVEESRLRDGKRIGYVSLPGGRNLSAELVEAGLAWPSVQRRGPLASSLAVLQMRAMSDRRGLWSEARTTSVSPPTPAAWRSSSAGDLAVRGNDESEGEAVDETPATDEPPAAEAGDAALGAN